MFGIGSKKQRGRFSPLLTVHHTICTNEGVRICTRYDLMLTIKEGLHEDSFFTFK